MSEEKFTKGEWGVTCFANGQPRIYRIGRDYKEPDIAGTYGNDDVANAHLIAAAPEMYTMLEKIHEGIAGVGEYGEFYYDVKELLAKALGEKC